MDSIIKTGGKQYIVSHGEELLVEKIKTDEKTVEFDDILNGGKVKAEILGEVKGEKLNIIKYRPRKNYLKRLGHRQIYTKVKIA
ncbi:MAG: 50S ribosomal protein L21 [Patescibacteria group bacterium]